MAVARAHGKAGRRPRHNDARYPWLKVLRAIARRKINLHAHDWKPKLVPFGLTRCRLHFWRSRKCALRKAPGGRAAYHLCSKRPEWVHRGDIMVQQFTVAFTIKGRYQ